MGAGESARSVAQRADASAVAHRKKADAAERMATQFRVGAMGEEALHAVLASLVDRGWSPLPDRHSPTGGNVDELLVGPTGVAVLDAKAWSHPVRVHRGRFYAGGRHCTDHLDHVLRQVDAVRDVLAISSLGIVAVRGFLALTGVDRDRAPEEVRGVWVAGVDRLAEGFRGLPDVLPPGIVAEVTSRLEAAFPEYGKGQDPAAPAAVTSHWLSERNVRVFYVSNWRSLRLYLKTPEGRDLGWKDLRSNSVSITCSGDDAQLVEAVLKNASPTGIGVSAEELPRIALDVPAGKLVGRVGHRWKSVLLGWESKRGGHRLYGTYLVPGAGTFPLGHVAMSTGAVSPLIAGAVGPGLRSAEEYLHLLWERWPGTRRR